MSNINVACATPPLYPLRGRASAPMERKPGRAGPGRAGRQGEWQTGRMDRDPNAMHPDQYLWTSRGPLAQEPPWTVNPRDRRYEPRRAFAECLGTFLLVIVAAGGPVVNALYPGQVPLDARVVAPGLAVMAIIYFMGMVSGAHLNPAVTLAFWVRGNFPWRRVPGYLVAQLVGACLAALLLRALFGNLAHLGATLPGGSLALWKAAVVEGVLTAGLVSVILGTASGARNVGSNAAIAVGGYIALSGLWAAPLTGASMNPARSLGPAVVAGDWHGWWVYLVGPLAGALLAVGIAWILRGPPSKQGDASAQGSLGDAPAHPGDGETTSG
jgi:aquaporin Z